MTNFFLLLKFFVKTEIGQRSRIYKTQDMHANSNEGIIFQTSSLVEARVVKTNP